MKKTWKGKHIGILGLGIEGLVSAEFFVRQGANITILDQKSEKELDQELLQEAKKLNVQFILGKHYLDDLTQFNILVRSPGIKRLQTKLQEAAAKGVIITSQTKLFFDLCPCPIVGVTGTKGKGTTASLIYEMLRLSKKDVYIGGNIGKPPLAFLGTLTPQSIVVLELSSFQLQDLTKSPYIAVLLMITSEHLDYHADTYEYVDAKRNLVRFQTNKDFAIINRDYLASHESDIYTDAKILQVSRERESAGDGCFVKDGKIVVRIAPGPARSFLLNGARSNEASFRELPSVKISSTSVTPRDITIINIKDIALPGKHNLENICAAVMAATLADVTKETIVSVLRSFKGLEHRLEFVTEVNGVKYYDDSFATTPEPTIAAIEAFKEPEILILGGSSKNADFTELGNVINKAKNIKAIIGIGEEWKRIKAQYPISNIQYTIIEGAKDMKTIVIAASKIAVPGDVVLLSPACASFGMFKNYKDRGEQFKREVNKLLASSV